MNGISKFVALVLAVALLAVPAAALSTCWTSSDAAQHDCCPLIMNMQQSTLAADGAASGTACCNLSSGRPVPRAQLQGPNSSPAAVNPLQTTAPVAIAIVPVRSGLRDSTPLKPLLSPQAVLCTFLI